jgi:ATP-dependent DNA helicase RecG
MLSRTELLEAIRNGENSFTELKEDTLRPEDLATEICALLNFEGGYILLGVADDHTVVGITRRDLEEWVMNICRDRLSPPVIPSFGIIKDVDPGRDVAIIQLPNGLSKPYARVHNSRHTYYIRVGTTNREASRDELLRLFQAGGLVRFGVKPVVGALPLDLDPRRLEDYLVRVLKAGDLEPDERARIAHSLEFLVEAGGDIVPTADGILLFGLAAKRYIPQSGIRAIAYAGTDPDYAALADVSLVGPMVGLFDRRGELLEAGLVEQAIAFIRSNAPPVASIVDGRNVEAEAFPIDVLREVVVNALVHRDYSIGGTDITVTLYADRLEVASPGRLPNTATVEALRTGFRYARNQTLVNVMKDYGYADARGMGVRLKIIPGMRLHNATEPELLEGESSFTVRLRR